MEPLIYLVAVVFLGLALSSIERNPRLRRSMRRYVALTVAIVVVYLLFQAMGIEQRAAFLTTFGLFAVALVVLFAVQRLRRPA